MTRSLAICLAIAAAPHAPGQVDRALQLEIDRAISSGVHWLSRQMGPDREPPVELAPYPFGEDCLALYALLVAGAGRGDPAVVALVERARRAAHRVDHTYTLSLACLALATHDRREHASVVSHLVARLEAGQIVQGDRDAVGAWGYLVPRSRTGAAGDFAGHPVAHWPTPEGWWDDSNTQYAVLALRSAADFGFRVDGRVFRRAAEHFVRRQRGDGGFSYSESHRPKSYVSMTAGAVGSLLMCRDLLEHDVERERRILAREIERAIGRGIRWMGKHLEYPPTDAPWPFYAAYAVERMGHYSGTDAFGDVEWYREGALWLTEVQRGDGSWSVARLLPSPRKGTRRHRADFSAADYGSVVDTCFALLFLRRASFVHTAISDEITVLLENLDPQAGAAELERIEERIVSTGLRGVPQLVKGLYLPVRAARDLADRCLCRLTGEDMGFRTARDEDERRRARERWVRWLLRHPEIRDR